MQHNSNNQTLVQPSTAVVDPFARDREQMGKATATSEGAASSNQHPASITLPLEMHSLTNAYGERLRLSLLQTCRPCVDRDGIPFKGYYVTADGSVISTKQRRPRRMRPTRSDSKLYVVLLVNGMRTTAFLHRLVAFAWLGPPPTPHHRVFHLDGDGTHNSAANLRWAKGTVDRPMIPDEQIETVHHLRGEGKTFDQIAEATGRRTETVGHIVCGRKGFQGLGIEEGRVIGSRSSKLTSKDVDEIRKMWQSGEFTQTEIGAVFGIGNSAVSYIVRGKRWRKVTRGVLEGVAVVKEDISF